MAGSIKFAEEITFHESIYKTFEFCTSSPLPKTGFIIDFPSLFVHRGLIHNLFYVSHKCNSTTHELVFRTRKHRFLAIWLENHLSLVVFFLSYPIIMVISFVYYSRVSVKRKNNLVKFQDSNKPLKCLENDNNVVNIFNS